MVVSTRDAAAFFGITSQALHLWFKNGCPKVGYGKCDLKAVFDWWRENIDSGGDRDKSINAAKRDYWRAKAERERISVDTLKGNVVPREQIATAWKWRVAEVKNGLLAFRDRLPPLLEGKTRKEITHVLGEEVIYLLDNYSREGEFCPRVEEQKKSSGGRKKSKPASRRKN